MKFTEKWVWQKQPTVKNNTYHYSPAYKCQVRDETDINGTWMEEYRNKVRAIDTDEKAATAIRDYWTEIVNELKGGLL